MHLLHMVMPCCFKHLAHELEDWRTGRKEYKGTVAILAGSANEQSSKACMHSARIGLLLRLKEL